DLEPRDGLAPGVLGDPIQAAVAAQTLGQTQLAGLRRLDERAEFVELHAAPAPPMGKRGHRRGEAVAPQMAGLPHPAFELGTLDERAKDRLSEGRAATVTLTVGAHEVPRLGDQRAG